MLLRIDNYIPLAFFFSFLSIAHFSILQSWKFFTQAQNWWYFTWVWGTVSFLKSPGPIDRTLSGATTPGQSGPGSDGNKGVLCIPQSSSITEASPSNCFVSYPGHLLWGGVLLLCRDAVSVFCSRSWLGPICVYLIIIIVIIIIILSQLVLWPVSK